MREHVKQTIQSTILIWTILVVAVIIISGLYSALSAFSVPENSRLLIAFFASVGLIALGLLFIPGTIISMKKEGEASMLRWSFQTENGLKQSQAQTNEKLMQQVSAQQQMIEELFHQVEMLTRQVAANQQVIEELLTKTLVKGIEQESQKLIEASYYFSEGTKDYREGDNRHAIENFLEALKYVPTNPHILERIGRAYSNLNDTQNAILYLEKALTIDPSFVPALRSLALSYRYTDREKAIEYLNRALKIDPLDYEAWDFLGLVYRDQGLIDQAISSHEKALVLKKRPETEFYLSILYFKKGDTKRAKLMALLANDDISQAEHDERIRPVWKILIHAAVPIMEGDLEEAVKLISTLPMYITTQRIYEAIKSHLQLLLQATDHEEWVPRFMEILSHSYAASED